MQDVEALGKGGHDPVLDAVVHHLDEVARTRRSAVQIALLLRRQFTGTTRRTLDITDTWGNGLQDRVDDLDRFFVTAHHQAVAAFQTEDATAGTDVDVMKALLPEPASAPYIVAVVGVAAVNDDVALVEQPGQLVDGLPCDASGDHHPDRTRPLELVDKFLQREAAGRSLTLKLLDGIGIHIKDDTFVPVTHQTANDVGTHPAQTDHSQLHGNPSSSMVSST